MQLFKSWTNTSARCCDGNTENAFCAPDEHLLLWPFTSLLVLLVSLPTRLPLSGWGPQEKRRLCFPSKETDDCLSTDNAQGLKDGFCLHGWLTRPGLEVSTISWGLRAWRARMAYKQLTHSRCSRSHSEMSKGACILQVYKNGKLVKWKVIVCFI